MALRRASGVRPLYTAQDVARFCEVDLKTVHHWVNKGKVPCFRTEGRHLRFRRNDVVRFLRAHGYPIPDGVSRARPTVAFALAGHDEIAKKLTPRFALKRHPTALAAIASLLVDQPDVLVLAIEDPTIAGARSLTALKSSPATAWVVLAALTADEALAASAREAGAEIALATRDAAKLGAELGRALAIA